MKNTSLGVAVSTQQGLPPSRHCANYGTSASIERLLRTTQLPAGIESERRPSAARDDAALALYCHTGDSTKFSTHGDPNYLKAFTVPAWIGGAVEPVYSLDDMAADAASLVPHLGAERAHFMGSSMGGMITQIVAINHPDRVSISSCVSSTGAKDVKDATLWSKSWFLFGPATPADEDVIANKVKWYEGVGCSPASLAVRGKAFNHATVRRQVKHSSYVAGIGRQIMAIMTAPSRDEKLKNVTCPALVYHGMQDVVVPYERGIRTAEMLPDATFVVEPRMGHTVMPEFYPRLVELMRGRGSPWLPQGISRQKYKGTCDSVDE